MRDYIPDRTVTLLYADGGTGKSYLKLQLAVARALVREWIGLMPEPGRTLVCSTEDDIDEMWRRIEGILPFYGAKMAALSDMRLVDLVGENSILGLLTKGIIEPTPMYNAIDAMIGDFKPGLVCLDVLADMFSGSENDRPQVTQFIGLLKKLCRKHSCAILLLAQPSVSGISTDTGTSGSTGWGNAGRSRLWFKRAKTPEGDEPNKNLRTFQGKKANYSEIGGKFDVEWKDGLFVPLHGLSGIDKILSEAKADAIFLKLLAMMHDQDREVSSKKSPTYAPKVFERMPGAEGLKARQFEDAMERLLAIPKIRVDTYGPPSKLRSRLILLDYSPKQ